jgi:flagellar basal body rod protein FlgG
LELQHLSSPADVGLGRDGYFTVREAVAHSRISRSGLFHLMKTGTLPYVQMRRKRLIPRRSLAELLASHTTIATQTNA